MLGDLDAGVEGLGRVVEGDAHALLSDDFPSVDVFVDEVDRAAGLEHARVERLLPGAESLEGWQERRMDIDDPVGKRTEKRLLHDAHVAGENDPLDVVCAEQFHQRSFAFGAELGAERRGRKRGGG